MSNINYYVYISTEKERECPHFDSLEEAIEKYNDVPMEKLGDSVFLGIQSDDISPTNGVCFDVIHKFFNDNMLINDWQNHKGEENVINVVREIIKNFHITYQMTHDIFKGNCYAGTLIPFASSWVQSDTNEKMSERWDEAYITSCNTKDFISIGWKSNNRQTRETYGWSYKTQACYIDRLNVEFVDSNGYVFHRDIDPREYLAYHGKMFTDCKVMR